MASVISSAILRTQSDERLVTLSRTGHQRAFEAIVERYRAELTRSVHRFLPSASVEDVLQQTHLEAWRALSGGTEVRELRAWLHRIARNAAIAVASRGYDYDELKDALQGGPGPEEELERREAVRRALRGIAELPERQREALLAVAVGGRSHAEVAFDLGITDTAARQLVRRARVSLTALATVLTPPQLVLWAARAGHTIVAGKVAAGAGLGGSLAGPAVKAGVIALTVGGVAVGVAPIRQALVPSPTPAPHHHRHIRPTHPQALVAGTLRQPSATHTVGYIPTPSVVRGPGSIKTRTVHHRHRSHANPLDSVQPTAPANPISAAAPTPPPASTAPAAAPAQPNGLAALIAWAIAHASQPPAASSVSISTSWSVGGSTPGSPGQAASPTQSPQGSAGGYSRQCSAGTVAGTPAQTQTGGAAGASAGGSSTGCASTGTVGSSTSAG